MKHIPFLLIISRLLIALIIAVLTFLFNDPYPFLIAMLIIIGLLTDVFDGIIARKLNVATENLRVWDSNVDVIFWLASLVAVFTIHLDFLVDHLVWVALLFGAEAITYLVSFVKFKRTVATHTYLAKFWTVTLLIFLVDLLLTADSHFLFWLCIISGFISRLEIVLILLKLKNWQTDVSSILVLNKQKQS